MAPYAKYETCLIIGSFNGAFFTANTLQEALPIVRNWIAKTTKHHFLGKLFSVGARM